MDKIVLFGHEPEFAIRLGFTKTAKKFFLQLLVKGIEMGNFKKSDTLQRSLDAYQQILKKKENMCHPLLNKMSKDEIWKYISDVDIGMDEVMTRFDMLNESGVFPLFGRQFSNQQSRLILLFNSNILRFIWQNDFGEAINQASVEFAEFCRIFEEYKGYCKSNNLL